MDWFKSERQKWATPIKRVALRSYTTLPGFDMRSRELYGKVLENYSPEWRKAFGLD